MIVSFLLDTLQTNLRQLGWAYYVFADRCRTNGWKCVVEQKYLSWQLNEQDKKDLTDAQLAWNYVFKLDSSDIQGDVSVIPEYIFEECHRQFGALSVSHLLLEPWPPLEEYVNALLDDYETVERVSAIVIYPNIPASIQKIAHERNIPVFVLEVAPMRWPIYTGAAYLTHFDQLSTDPGECQHLYHQFQKYWNEKKLPLLTREQILAIYLENPFLPYLRYLKITATREALLIGTGINAKSDLPHNWDGTKNLVKRLRDRFGNQLCFRPDGRDPYEAHFGIPDEQYSQESPNIVSILRSKRVACAGSNMMFEAMLWGRPVYCDTKDHGLYFISNHTDNWKDEQVPEDFLNFFAFVYVAPMDIATKDEYVKWRLTEPSLKEIYYKHLNHYLSRWGLTSNQIMGKTPRESVDLITAAKGIQGSCFPRDDLPEGEAAWSMLHEELGFSIGTVAERLLAQQKRENELNATIAQLEISQTTIQALQNEKKAQEAMREQLTSDVEKLQNEIHLVSEEYQTLRSEFHDQGLQAETLRSETQSQSIQIQSLRSEAQLKDATIEEILSDKRALDDSNKELLREQAKLEEKIQSLLEERNVNHKRITALEDELSKFYQSRSWRLTAPLRWFVRKIRLICKCQ